MGSPPSRDTALEAPSFTPSHPLLGRLLSFTEFLLGNIEDWSKPHPFCPPPPPPLSFSGADRFIKGRLPHRTVAISSSLSSVFDRTCNHGDARDADNPQNVTHLASAQELQVKDRTQAPTNAQIETAGISTENEPIFSDGADHVFQDERLVDHNDCVHSSHADSQMILGDVSDKSSDVKFVDDEQRIGGYKVLAGKMGVSSQINNLDQSSLEVPVTGKEFQGMGGTSNPPLSEQADDVEEGEISETFSAEKQLICMRECSDQGGANAKDGSPDSTKLAADAERGRAYDASSPDKLCTNAETDEEMDEPISSFVSRCRMQLLRNREEQKLSTQDINLKHSKKRTHNEMKKEQLSRIATATDAEDDRGFSCSQIDSIPVSALSISDPIGNMSVFGVIGASDKQSVQLFVDGGGNQPEKLNGSSTTATNGGLCLSTFEVGNNEKLPSQEQKKKTIKGRVTVEKKKKKQREKEKANERKIANSGICKLKFKPFVEKKQKKTCSFYVQGKCNKSASSCPFSHDVVPLTKSEVCKYFVTNRCLKGEQCFFSHSLSSFPCRRFHVKGSCIEGESCRFSHEPISEETKQELLQKIEDEQRTRQNAHIKTVQDAVRVTKLGYKHDSSKFGMHMKGKEVTADGLPMVCTVANDHSRLVATNKVALASSSAQVPVSTERFNRSAFSQSHDMTQPSPNECRMKSFLATSMENRGAVSMSPSGSVGKPQERRTKAEAFLQAQLNETRTGPAMRLATGSEKIERVSGSLFKDPMALPMGHATPIRVSDMSGSCRRDGNALQLQSFSLLETASKKSLPKNGAQVSGSSMTLLDMLLKPQGKVLSKEPVSSVGTQEKNNSMPCNKSASNIFLDRILR